MLELAGAVHRREPARVGAFLLNPDLTTPGSIEPLLATGKVAFADQVDPAGAGILHVMSPIELEVPLERLWPEGGGWRHLRLVVTVFDLIPEVFPDRYLEDPGLRRRYRARLALVRAADHVLAISRATADDVAAHLGVEGDRLTVVGGGTAAHFVPPASREAAAATATALVPGLRPPFVLYTGGIEDRKNIDRLLVAWSTLAPEIDRRHQLVIACRVGAPQRADLERRAAELGIGRFLLTGYVSDPALVALCQSTELFVFPSLYEGFGLPVAEAMACGAPTIAARTSSLPELVGDEALFDPLDPAAIAAAIARGLTDADRRQALLEAARRPPPSWDAVAAATLGAYDAALAGRPSRRRAAARPRLAVASPLPPDPSGIALFTHRLVEELGARCDVDVFVERTDPEPLAPAGAGVFDVDRLERVAAARGGYDRVVYCLGNSEFHAGALAALRRRPGLVLAHDVRLTDLYALSARRPDAVPGGFAATLQRLYGGRVPADLGASGRLTAAEASYHGVLMAREVVGLSQGFCVFSDFAAGLAALDAEPAHAGRIRTLPFAVDRVGPVRGDWALGGDGAVVASFGVVNEVKLPTTVVEAFALVLADMPDARLAFVGPSSEADTARLRAVAGGLGIAGRVEITGEVSDDEYAGWLGRADVAVQLRAVSNGESSAAAGNCLASGIPTVVSDLGAARALPGQAVAKVAPTVSPPELAAVIVALLGDEDRRRRMSAAALAHAGRHTFARLAEDLLAVALGS
ncbi:MAG TPA: glycosyltransferase [Acidimicrobiales bacterium]|nr:glycosyltransferase [Acidimicrobiales bacterium]